MVKNNQDIEYKVIRKEIKLKELEEKLHKLEKEINDFRLLSATLLIIIFIILYN